MQSTLFLLVAFFMGIVMSIYLPMNSSVSRHLGSPKDPVTLKKLIGATLVITGAALSTG